VQSGSLADAGVAPPEIVGRNVDVDLDVDVSLDLNVVAHVDAVKSGGWAWSSTMGTTFRSRSSVKVHVHVDVALKFTSANGASIVGKGAGDCACGVVVARRGHAE